MIKFDDDEIDTKIMDDLTKILKRDKTDVKVGIIGKNGRRESTQTNAQIGAKHEFGSEKLPIRSFLRMPLTEYLQKYLEKSKDAIFTDDLIKRILAAKSLAPLFERIGIIGVRIVMDAFNSTGFGKWRPSIMEFKNNHQTLVETGQLMKSIEYEVK